MTVALIPVRREDVRPLVGLTVAPEQTGFVTANAITLAEAPYETGHMSLASGRWTGWWDWPRWWTTGTISGSKPGRTAMPPSRGA